MDLGDWPGVQLQCKGVGSERRERGSCTGEGTPSQLLACSENLVATDETPAVLVVFIGTACQLTCLAHCPGPLDT